MQTREQVRNWKVIGSLATVAALGVSGLAIASTAPTENPPPIELDDQRNLGTSATTVTTSPGFEVVPGQSFSIDSGESLDSPLASGDLDTGSPDSPADSPDSPDRAPAPTVDVSADSPDSPDRAPAPAADSADSPASADSADSLDS